MSLQTTLYYMARQAYRGLNGVLQPGVWVQRGEGVYDPSTGEVVEPEPARYQVHVLLRQYPKDEVDGVRVLSTDKQLFVYQGLPTDVPPLSPQVPQGLPVQPTVRDEVEVGGVTWHLVSLDQDTARLTWQAQARSEGEG